MPRSAASKKAHSNHRHENGLVGPGKRITKQKSNGQINGNLRGAPPDTPPQSPILAAHPLLTSSTGNNSTGSLSEGAKDSTNLLRPPVVCDPLCEAAEQQQNGTLHPKPSEDTVKQRNEVTTARRATMSDTNPLQLASTILRSCPLYDTIAILILLLQLPPLVLTLVQALFASLTIMPPTGLSLGSFFSLFDVFQGSPGTPSLGTMMFVDAICLGGWYCLWTWARNFSLDLAQVQVAITLGGGSSGKGGGVNTFCVAIILVLHLFRSRGVRQFLFDYILSPKVFSDHQIAHVTKFLPRDLAAGTTVSAPSWIRSLFAIHIITQAGIALVRRRMHAAAAAQVSKPSKKLDTEASVAAGSLLESAAVETTTASISASGADVAPTSPIGREGKDRVVSVKKRRRQAHQVRSRQPFWAALASTKVTVMREYEQSKVSPPTTGRQNSEFGEYSASQESLVWISSISPSSIKFETSDVDFDTDVQDDDPNMGSKPFYVRINGAYWTATNIAPVEEETQAETNGAQWKGEIAGLAPNCTYTCSFVRSDDDQVFAVVTVKTPALPDTEQSSLLASPPARQLQRPSSPTTTIKNSITTAEVKLIEARNRLTRTRRAHKASLSKIEKEVDSFTSRLKTNSDDTKQRQKLLQAERNMRQTEDATQSITAVLEDLAVIPEEETDQWRSEKQVFDEQNALLTAANQRLEKARSSASTEVSTINDDFKTLSARRERLMARQSRLAEQHERITQANAQGLNEKERKAADTAAKEADHNRIETGFHNQYAILNREIQTLQMRTSQAWQEVQTFEKAAQQSIRIGSEPLTPEGPLPGTQSHQLQPNVPLSSRSAFGYSTTFNSAPFPLVTAMSPEPHHASPFLAYAKPMQLSSESYAAPINSSNGFSNPMMSSAFRARPRSSSNRSSGGGNSNVSADFEDADPIPPMPGNMDFADMINGERRKGSGSSRGANNGSPVTNTAGGIGSPIRGRGSPGQSIW